AGRRVTVMGLGPFGGGLAAARWLARQGARVTVTDAADESALAEPLAALAGEAIEEFHLGGHREADFRHAELLIVNPAVRPGNPWLEMARQAAVPLSSELELFLNACPARMIGVTGSNGKSTTAAMIAAILRADGRRAWLGGNIGRSLLDDLAAMRAEDWAVLELSSFQLWHLTEAARLPQIAVVSNCSPNHLDWHGTWADYVAAKQRLLLGQTPEDVAVLNSPDGEVASWRRLARGRTVVPWPLAGLPPLAVPGGHNRVNAACAAAAAEAALCSRAAIDDGLRHFGGLPQRLEKFAVIGGRVFYNDSTATTPESTTAALESLAPPIWLLAGGRDKGSDFSGLVTAMARRVRGAAFFGSMAAALERRLAAENPRAPCASMETLEEALRWCWTHSAAGDSILLSPACSSHDQFRNFRQRGETFVRLVSELAKQPLA
ncbi:MAG: UDP-N-acetylmuramoyl-L-alanine--D-glutamate ligase, partial [Thermoguttaceae bacterium]